MQQLWAHKLIQATVCIFFCGFRAANMHSHTFLQIANKACVSADLTSLSKNLSLMPFIYLFFHPRSVNSEKKEPNRSISLWFSWVNKKSSYACIVYAVPRIHQNTCCFVLANYAIDLWEFYTSLQMRETFLRLHLDFCETMHPKKTAINYAFVVFVYLFIYLSNWLSTLDWFEGCSLVIPAEIVTNKRKVSQCE